jgi:FAD/FMN-containing dehydrogenase
MKIFSLVKIPKKFFGFQNSSKIQRKNFKILNNKDLNYFKTILPPESILTELESNTNSNSISLDAYNRDWSGKFKGNSKLVLKPKTSEEISKILSYCNYEKIAVNPQSGNTGLVGGSVPVHDEIILSMTKMNKIINFNKISNFLHCESGCILENLTNFLSEKGYSMPLDLGAKGSCLIGGNLSTNAGGIHFVKYNSLRSNCKGLKFVLPNGDIIDCLNSLPKNNTGYDLKQLMIGSEGTLGIITECIINTPLKSKYNDLAILSLNKFEDVIRVYEILKSELESKISAVEFFDDIVREIQYNCGRINPIREKYKFYLLIEIESNQENNKELLQNFLEKLFEKELINDAVIAQDETQKKKIWELRETINEGAKRNGITLSYDISLPLLNFYEIVEETRKRIGNLATVIGYGHIGDFNLHLNVCYNKKIMDSEFENIVDLMEPFIFDYLVSVGGSISAEHGIGLFKAKYLHKNHSFENLKMMKGIKNLIDPNGIMNPYKLFDE